MNVGILFFSILGRTAHSRSSPSSERRSFLYELVEAAGLGLSKFDGSQFKFYRPVHGLHLLPSRGPGKKLCQPSLASWCGIMDAPNQGSMLCAGGNVVLQAFIEQIVSQEEFNMKVIDGVCQKQG